MGTFQFDGTTRTFHAGVPNINTGKTRKISKADEELYQLILDGKSASLEVPMDEFQQIEAKAAGSMFNQAGGWQPTTLGGQMIDQVRAKSRIRGFHQVIATPSDPYQLPVNLDNFTVSVGVAEGVVTASEKVNQSRLTFTHTKLMVATEVSNEFDEDSIPQSMAMLRDALAKNIVEAEEDQVFVNGATGIKNQSVLKTLPSGTDFPSDKAAQRVIDLLSQMDIPYNLDPQNLVMYIHPTLYWRLVQSNLVATQDAFGPNATVITGELGKFYGMSVAPLVALQPVASKYPIHIINRSSILIGQRRQLTINVIPIAGDKKRIEATVRSAIAYPYGTKGLVRAELT